MTATHEVTNQVPPLTGYDPIAGDAALAEACVRHADRATLDSLAGLGRPFHRVDRARGGPGSGLGLASVARVAALHGGGLRLRNRDGGGLEAELRFARDPA